MAGVALGAIDGPLVWHVLCMVTSTLRFCSGRGSEVEPCFFMTPRIVSVAGVPLCDIDGHCVWHVWCLVMLTVLDCAWDSWHVRSGLAVMLPMYSYLSS